MAIPNDCDKNPPTINFEIQKRKMKKNIVLAIILSIILKNAAFAVGIEGGIDTSCPVIQSAVFQVVSVLSMPSNIVSKLMKEMPLLNGAGQPLKGPAEKKSNHPRDNKCLFTMGLTKVAKPKLKAVNIGHGAVSLSKCADGCLMAANKVLFSPWETIICLLVSVFLILLPKRGPPLDYSISTIYTLPNCASGVIGFFNLWRKK